LAPCGCALGALALHRLLLLLLLCWERSAALPLLPGLLQPLPSLLRALAALRAAVLHLH
jgi:hypothetical protein